MKQAVKRARKFEKFCEVCGCRMMTAYATTRYCSENCRKAAYTAKILATEEPTEIIKCQRCGQDFPWYKKINSVKKKFCSQQCAARSGANKGNRVHNSHSLLIEKPCNVDRLSHCHRKIGPFEFARCRRYVNWGKTETQFHCDCEGGFTL
jgi:hypothetical protein